MRTIQHWIAGSETTGTPAMFGPVYDPATGRQQAQVALAERADVDAAVAAEVIEFACGIPTLLKGEHSEQVSTDGDASAIRPRPVSFPTAT